LVLRLKRRAVAALTRGDQDGQRLLALLATLSPDLAQVLNSQPICLSNLERQEEAAATAEDVASLYRELAGVRPDVFLPDLAGAPRQSPTMGTSARRFGEGAPGHQRGIAGMPVGIPFLPAYAD
jgi:hypothetical protein